MKNAAAEKSGVADQGTPAVCVLHVLPLAFLVDIANPVL
jgi:hypothetical protein